MDKVISGYRTVTGKSQIMPKWAMGFWLSRERYKTQEELLTALERIPPAAGSLGCGRTGLELLAGRCVGSHEL